MRVLKFGGTSLANPARFSQAAQLIEKAHFEEQAAGVLSAPAKLPTILSPFLKSQFKSTYRCQFQ
ncbi:bifunctional aspartokinase I/homoserine dehydrogenase I [Pasteurella multocida subsp. multocida str. Anand1_cattle]|nr:bifunctional aspartokinase I/homoserine dehydrogenase I [Pasteurella multocida subsp. multocida str. Anand1_cattle]